MKKMRRGASVWIITLLVVLSTLSVYGAGSPMMNVVSVDGSCPRNAETSAEVTYGEAFQAASVVRVEPVRVAPRKIGSYVEPEKNYIRLKVTRDITMGTIKTKDERIRTIPLGNNIAESGVLIYACKLTEDGVVLGLKKTVTAERMEMMSKKTKTDVMKYTPTWTYCAASRTICELLARGWALNHLSPMLPPTATSMGSPASV